MYKEISEQSTLQPFVYNLPPVNYNPFMPQLYFVAQEVPLQTDYKKEF